MTLALPSLAILAIFAFATLLTNKAWAYYNGEDWIGKGDDTLYSTSANWYNGRETTSTSAVRFDGQADKTVTFDGVYTIADYTWIGSTVANTYIDTTDADNWVLHPVTWEATAEEYGFTQSSGKNLLISDGANQNGALVINSGTYSIGGSLWVGRTTTSVGYLEVNGGTITVGSEFNIANWGANCRFKMTGGSITANGKPWWGTDSGTVSKSVISGGDLTVNADWTIINGTGSTCDIAVAGGDVTAKAVFFGHGGSTDSSSTATLAVTNNGSMVTTEDFYFGSTGYNTATLTVADGGLFQNGTATTGKWFKFGESGTGTRTININDGGTLAVCHFQSYGTGSTQINFNGGTLKQIFTDTGNCKYLLGSTVDANDANVTVTVDATNGGTIDTNGKNVYIKNIAIGGSGTLTITGGGTITFETLPTCPIYVEQGVAVFTSDTTPSTITLGENGFIKYDLSSVSATTEDDTMTLPDAQTLATGVTITLADDDDTLSVADHVLVANDHVINWVVTYSGTTLTATAQQSVNPETAIWLGGYSTANAGLNTDYGQWWTEVGNWVRGIPASGADIIVPYASALHLAADGNPTAYNCNNLYLRTTGDVRIYNKRARYSWYHACLYPVSITGDGTLILGGIDMYASSTASCTVDVPVKIEYDKHYSGNSSTGWYDFTVTLSGYSETYLMTLNKTLTVPVDVPCIIGNYVVINGDIEVDGTVTFSKTQEIKADISGSGTISGSFTTASGATLKCGIGDTGSCTNVLTCTGTADLSNLSLDITGGEYASTTEGAEIIIFQATTINNWTEVSKVISGQTAAWKIQEGSTTVDETTYETLKLVRCVTPEIAITIDSSSTAISDEGLNTWLVDSGYDITTSDACTTTSAGLNTANSNGISPIGAYLLGYDSFTASGDDATEAPAVAVETSSTGWTLAYDLDTSDFRDIDGLKLQYYIESSANADFSGTNTTTTKQDDSAVTLSVTDVDSSKPYNRLCAEVVSTEGGSED